MKRVNLAFDSMMFLEAVCKECDESWCLGVESFPAANNMNDFSLQSL